MTHFTSEPAFQTDLGQTPLPEILVKIYQYQAPGRIDCRRDDMVKRVYLERGKIIFATTNQITESLGDRLLNAGRITRAQYDESLRQVRTSGMRHGAVLVEMNVLPADELFTAVQEHIQAIIWSIFEWDYASVAFFPGRDKHLEFVKVEIPVPQAVLRGVHRMPDARALLSRIGTRTTLLEKTKITIENLTLEDDEKALLAAANGKTPLADLVNVGGNTPAENARVLYGLFTLGLLAPKAHVRVQLKSTRPDE